jgi:hypothetical protein
MLQVARENQLSRFGALSLDGTKIHANASRHHTLWHGHAEKIEAQLEAELQEMLELADLGRVLQHEAAPPKPESPNKHRIRRTGLPCRNWSRRHEHWVSHRASRLPPDRARVRIHTGAGGGAVETPQAAQHFHYPAR